jgi:hypothetical protein
MKPKNSNIEYKDKVSGTTMFGSSTPHSGMFGTNNDFKPMG